MRLVFLLLLCAFAFSEEVPSWVLKGILGVESSSAYNADGTINYVNEKRGRDGEIGPFQMTRAAFKMVAQKGDDFARMGTDPAYAETMAVRYLLHLRARTQSWDSTVRAYNVGLGGLKKGRGKAYLNAVKAWNKDTNG